MSKPAPQFFDPDFDLEAYLCSEVVRHVKATPEYQRAKAEDEAAIRDVLYGAPGGAVPQGVIECKRR